MRDLKWLPPSLPAEIKNSVSVKNLMEGEGDWTCAKEVLGRIVDTKTGIVVLPERKLQEIRGLQAIPTTQRRMGGKYIKRLVRKLRSMNLAVHGEVEYL